MLEFILWGGGGSTSSELISSHTHCHTVYHVGSSSGSLGLSCHTLLREKPGDQILEVVEGPLAKVVCGEHLKLTEQLNKKVRPRLVVGNERSHLRVYGIPESVKD